jgi:hypothetical protein
MKETDMSGGTDPWYCSWPRGLGVMLGGGLPACFSRDPPPSNYFVFAYYP